MDVIRTLSEALNAVAVPVGEGAGDGIGHHRFVLPDPVEPPVVLDVLATPGARPERVTVLLPGGGLNVRANYCTARGRGLARFLADHGRLVIGITPREDGLTGASTGPRCATWGLAAHRRDVQRVLTAVLPVLGLPHELLGHSAGAVLALDTAARPGSTADRVLVLDSTGPYDPATDPEWAARAGVLADTLANQLARGVWTTDPGLSALFDRATADPAGSSPFPRPGHPGTAFSNLGLLHYALTHTGELPGPANWIYHRGHSSGTFTFGATPGEDRFALDRTPIEVWARAVAALGSGLQPNALLRDLAAVWAGRTEVYRIDWAAISADVVWVNTELGRGDHDLGARLIRAGGARVDYQVVPGYGHGDVVWAPGAEREVWPLLLG
ncbi:hypothetical protein OG455_35085 [Kitasatospora sp. NBC_01287]|uniref:alpha/beta hydrolase n=1 Tax=Kitasatospora sp. NBC_01287 TaxID=2903573 RepID=UPI00225299B2|nr:hypothetical protein [Kitasatospora sp. NBC_01287]MCX4750673.1 hypothetical protein [Kitasatospora sp. NBC_01287]